MTEPPKKINTRLAIALAMTVAGARMLQSARDSFMFDIPTQPPRPNRAARRAIRGTIQKKHR